MIAGVIHLPHKFSGVELDLLANTWARSGLRGEKVNLNNFVYRLPIVGQRGLLILILPKFTLERKITQIFEQYHAEFRCKGLNLWHANIDTGKMLEHI